MAVCIGRLHPTNFFVRILHKLFISGAVYKGCLWWALSSAYNTSILYDIVNMLLVRDAS
jgi:hypothetical protein